jgi:short subunit dehydrogenase-like uncharacterized protein
LLKQMACRLLVYGAAGFTGRLIVEEALAFGLRPIVAGRSAQALEKIARAAGLEYRVASMEQPARLASMLDGVSVVLNAAGPFRATALPLVEACLARGVHYLDISGEIPALQSLAERSRDAVGRGVMIMPATGFDVVPTDCMAAWVARCLPSANSLSIGFTGLDSISRGSAASTLEQYEDLVTVRRAGRLVRITPGELERDFDFGSGPVRTTAITWGDVVTAYHSTGIPDITVYYEATAVVRLGLGLNRSMGWLLKTPGWKWWLKTAMEALPEGPDAVERARARARIVAIATDARGQSAEVRLETPEVYSFTATSSIAIADRVLHGDLAVGFQTPAQVYGPEFVLTLPGVKQTVS